MLLAGESEQILIVTTVLAQRKKKPHTRIERVG